MGDILTGAKMVRDRTVQARTTRPTKTIAFAVRYFMPDGTLKITAPMSEFDAVNFAEAWVDCGNDVDHRPDQRMGIVEIKGWDEVDVRAVESGRANPDWHAHLQAERLAAKYIDAIAEGEYTRAFLIHSEYEEVVAKVPVNRQEKVRSIWNEKVQEASA